MNVEIIFRWLFAIALFGAFTISSVYRKRAREEGGTIARQEEGAGVLFLRLGLALPLFVGLLLYIFYPEGLAWSFTRLPQVLRWLFAAVALGCVPLLVAVFRNIGKNISETVLIKEGHELVTSGPYRWVRHPLYTTALLLIGAFSVISTSWFLFLYFLLALVVFRFVVVPQEEKRLVAAFGEAYRVYQKQTGALFPKLF